MASGFQRIHWNEFLLKLRHGSIARSPLLEGIKPDYHRKVLLRIAYDRRHGFFYARIPKAANSTVVATLVQHMEGGARRDPAAAKERLNRFPSPAQFRRAYRFTFVRDPATRILSAYLDKVAAGHGKGAALMEDAPDREFITFLRELEAKDYFRNGHYLPQTTMLPGGTRAYDKIGRVERLDDDLREVCERIFGRYDGMVREDAHKTGSANKADLLGPEERAIIARIYAEDYRLLGYAPD